MTPIVSSMIAPAEISIAKDLNITGGQLQSQLIFSIFLLAFAIAPFVLAPLSEIFGRMIVLQVSNMYGYLPVAGIFESDIVLTYANTAGFWFSTWPVALHTMNLKCLHSVSLLALVQVPLKLSVAEFCPICGSQSNVGSLSQYTP
jgi:MFS family permease